MNHEFSRLPLFVFTSMGLHALLLAWYYHDPFELPELAKKTQEVSLSIGMSAAIAGATLVTPASAEPSPQESVEPEPVAKVEPKNLVPTAKPVVKTPVVKKVETKPLPKKKEPAKKTPPPAAKPVVKPVTKEVAKKPAPTKAVNQVGAQGVSGSKSQSTNRQQETGIGEQSNAGSNADQFDFFVRQHLHAKKKTPKILRSRQQRGIVEVEFTIDRQGNLLAHKISKPSRIREFDRAADELVRAAAPYPKVPSHIIWEKEERTFNITINYSIK